MNRLFRFYRAINNTTVHTYRSLCTIKALRINDDLNESKQLSRYAIANKINGFCGCECTTTP